MTRSLNGANSGTIYIDEDIEFHQQVVLEDKFLIITWYRPERNWETSSGVGWMAEHANKTILKGNFSYKDGRLHGGTITETASFHISRSQDGSLKETGYGYKFDELAYVTNNNNVYDDNSASGVSFSYSNDPTTEWNKGGSSPKLGGFPISNDRSVIKTSGFSQFVQEGWLDNPFHLYTDITIATANDSYIPDSNGFSSVSGEAPVDINVYEVGEESTLESIKDYDGNLHAGNNLEETASSYKYQGMLDVNGDSIFEAIFTNKVSKRWVTVKIDSVTGQVDFDDNGAGGGTRVVGIYEDPLIAEGNINGGYLSDGVTPAPANFGVSDADRYVLVNGETIDRLALNSQVRIENDLEIDNLSVKHSGDYDSDGIHEVYWKTTDGTAYLRALMHDDGNIRYANYQSEEQMSSYLTAQGHESVIAEII